MAYLELIRNNYSLAQWRQLALFHHVLNVYQRRSQVVLLIYLYLGHCKAALSQTVYFKIRVLINWRYISLIIIGYLH